MKTKYTFILAVCLLFTSGCAFHTGTFQPSTVLLSQHNRVAGTAFGKVTTFHFLGIGGLNREAIIYEARQQIIEHYPLPKGMLLANATVNVKKLFVFVGIQTTYTVSCDLIDTRPEYSAATYKGFYTDDSTFFPLHHRTPSPGEMSSIDRYGSVIGVGQKVAFLLNGEELKGKLVSIDKYGYKCEYETIAGKRYIYLRQNDFYIVY